MDELRNELTQPTTTPPPTPERLPHPVADNLPDTPEIIQLKAEKALEDLQARLNQPYHFPPYLN